MRSRLVIPIREPIESERLEWLLPLVEPSEEQARFIEARHQDYLRAASARRSDIATRLWEKSSDAAEMDAKSPERARLFAEVVAAAHHADDQLAMIDESFFLSWEPVLTESQLVALDRVRSLNQRLT